MSKRNKCIGDTLHGGILRTFLLFLNIQCLLKRPGGTFFAIASQCSKMEEIGEKSL